MQREGQSRARSEKEARLATATAARATMEAALEELNGVPAHIDALAILAPGDAAPSMGLFSERFGRRTLVPKLVLISLGKLRPSLRSPYIQTLRITLAPLQFGTCRGNMSHTFHGSL